VEQERDIATLTQAALLLNVSPTTIAGWRDSKKLGPAPWSAAELWAVKNRPGAPLRRRCITSKHGTISRYNVGCRCDLCRTAGNAYAREHVRDYERAMLFTYSARTPSDARRFDDGIHHHQRMANNSDR
jgi:hypothetical protein